MSSPTFAPTLFDATMSNTLVLGMGVGTFTLIVLTIGLSIIWCLSAGCDMKPKALARTIASIIYGIIFLVLVFSPRRDNPNIQHDNTNPGGEVYIYDYSIIPRISIWGVAMLFSIIALIILLVDLSESIQLSTVEYNPLAFWLDE